jgi:malonyl-CoA O-methyltransferase
MSATMLDRDRAYAEWANAYPPYAHNALMEVEQAAMTRLLPPLKGQRVLDAGCGTGRYARLVSAGGAATVVALDRSAAMLNRAKLTKGLVRADVLALPFADASFDVVVSGLVIPDVADLISVVDEWRRILRPDGLLLYSTLHPSGARLGWTRTFETPNGRWELPAHWHTSAAHRAACASAGLNVEAMAEPSLPDGNPVALVIRARRMG